MYGAVDLYLAEQLAASADISAVATKGRIMQTIIRDTTILLMQLLGQYKSKEAANATVTSQSISVLISLVIICRILTPFQMSIKDITLQKDNCLKIFNFGFPPALADFLVSLSF